MQSFRNSVPLQNSEVAASKAVKTTTKWLGIASLYTAIAVFCFCFVLYLLYKHQLFEKKPVETSVGVVVTFAVAVLPLIFPWDQINNDVRAAISAAVGERIREYREQNPTIDEIGRIQLQDYSQILNVSKSESIIRLCSQDRSVYDKRVGRDAIIRGLAYNDALLRSTAKVVANKILGRADDSGGIIPKNSHAVFVTDIYSYLKGWLMLSIMYDHIMPVSTIRQRYPNENNPRKELYNKAIALLRRNFTRDDKILNTLRPQHPSEPDYSSQAVALLEKYLAILADQLTNPYH